MRHEELIGAKDEEGALSVGKYIVAVDPSARLGRPFFVVWIGSAFYGTH